MRVLINTDYNPNSASMRVCVHEMTEKLVAAGHDVTRNDWLNYHDYELVLFMGFDSKAREAKLANPDALVGIMSVYLFEDWQRADAAAADFLLADSIEMREKLLQVNKNVFVYYMFPVMDEINNKKSDSDGKVIIGYHGSKTHLHQAVDLIRAVDALSQDYEIEFWAIYNIEHVGKWIRNVPTNCPVKHIQWSDENLYRYLAKCDIGVAPGTIPINRPIGLRASRIFSSFWNNWPHYSHTDHLIRFKLPTNPARLYPFSRLHVPVVAEFVPSFGQFIQDGKSGHLVWGEEGWYRGLESLIVAPDSRSKMGSALKEYIDLNHAPQLIFERFLEYVDSLNGRKLSLDC